MQPLAHILGLLLATMCALVLRPIFSSTCDVIGVHPKDCARYSPSSSPYFLCGDNPNKKIPFKHVNDDYCDCVGSGDDEPGTSACNSGKFWCENAGYRGRFIYSSLVNDGLCDCCDGSDEQKHDIIKCPNTCNEKAKSEMSEFLEQKKKYQQGIQIKNSLYIKAKSKLNEKSKTKQEINNNIDLKRNELLQEQHKKRIAEENEKTYKERKEKEKEEKRLEEEKRCELDPNCNNEEEEIEEENPPIIDNSDDTSNEQKDYEPESQYQRRRRERKERHKLRAEKNEKRREERKKQSESLRVKATEAVNKAQNNKLEKDEIIHTPDEEFPYPEEYRPHPNKIDDNDIIHTPDEEFPYPEEYRPHPDNEEEGDDGFDWSEFDDDDDDDDDDYDYDINNVMAMDEDEPCDDDDDDGEQDKEDDDPVLNGLETAVRDATNEVRSIEQSIKNLEKELTELDDLLDMDFGEKNIFAALMNECYSTKIAKYDYEFCPFGKAAQKEGHSSTDLGTFESFGYNDKDKLIMSFEDGQKCWNGPKRSVSVQFECNIDNEIVAVNEPSTCKYAMTFHTPLACKQEELNKLNDIITTQFKQEL